MSCFPSDQEYDKVGHFLSHYKIDQHSLLVGIHPGSRLSLKNWETGKYSTVADTLIEEYGARIIIVGKADEKVMADEIIDLMKHEAINACGLLNLRELSVLMERINLFICGDSAPMHLASGANIPIIALFGPSEWWDTGPLSGRSIVQKMELDCRRWCDSQSCNNKVYQYCLKAIQPADVLRSCRQMLLDPNNSGGRNV
jgi:ADP-heptose:LPS heptosyltransferase